MNCAANSMTRSRGCRSAATMRKPSSDDRTRRRSPAAAGASSDVALTRLTAAPQQTRTPAITRKTMPGPATVSSTPVTDGPMSTLVASIVLAAALTAVSSSGDLATRGKTTA